jgi:hypothetical protein
VRRGSLEVRPADGERTLNILEYRIKTWYWDSDKDLPVQGGREFAQGCGHVV